MMDHWLKRRTGYTALITGLMLSCSFWIAAVALAKYRPPKNPSAPKITTAAITRGGSCEANSSPGLTALVPFSHVGQTSSQHPTFTWFVSDRTPRPLQFRLYTSNRQLLYKTQMQSQPGMMQFSLPQDQPGLAIGQAYRWQVVLVCDLNVSSMNIVTAAEIQVAQPSSALQTQLAAVQTPQQRIDLYAEAGLWFDAIAEASKSSQSQSAVLELLDSLATSEAQSSKDWSDRLIQIEKIERQRQEQR
ncbi:MAG: DUF928 domain-containing protein [Plectolyngbya sp. WJT66-NPBG17]|jgi:hypothetical protein|nr:DUF928 domain-containing protein [Plectolyngbya sp. WJT66-NPBG17]